MEVLKSISKSELSSKIVSLSKERLPTERTLGVEWDVELDSLMFSTKMEKKPEIRRGILANVASMFDPLGLLASFTLTACILLQDLWDEPLDENEVKRWREWKSNLPKIAELRIPRQVMFNKQRQLHLFSDASEKGYGAVVYVRSEVASQQWCSRLILAKAKVAPIKSVTLPRLELTAAVLATRLYRIVSKHFESIFDRVIFWTDSVLVLRYINNTTSRFVTFVTNRVQEILECSSADQWRYVNTKENPADLASRGMIPIRETIDRWLHGPKFLIEQEETWREEGEIPTGDVSMEIKRILTTKVETTPKQPMDYLLDYFSSWKKLKKSVAWLSRWKTYLLVMMRKREKMQVEKAEKDIFVYVQMTAYPKEYVAVVKKQGSNRVQLRRSEIRRLNPIEYNGLLCVGSRLKGAQLSVNSRYPIILPKRHAVTEGIIWDVHKAERHAGLNHLTSMLRERFWIVNMRATVKKVTRVRLIFTRKLQNSTKVQL